MPDAVSACLVAVHARRTGVKLPCRGRCRRHQEVEVGEVEQDLPAARSPHAHGLQQVSHIIPDIAATGRPTDGQAACRRKSASTGASAPKLVDLLTPLAPNSSASTPLPLRKHCTARCSARTTSEVPVLLGRPTIKLGELHARLVAKLIRQPTPG